MMTECASLQWIWAREGWRYWQRALSAKVYTLWSSCLLGALLKDIGCILSPPLLKGLGMAFKKTRL